MLRAGGRLDQAAAELGDVLAEAAAHGWSALEADARHERALVHLAADRPDAARTDLNEALVLRIRDHAPPLVIDSTMIAIGALLDRAPAAG